MPPAARGRGGGSGGGVLASLAGTHGTLQALEPKRQSQSRSNLEPKRRVNAPIARGGRPQPNTAHPQPDTARPPPPTQLLPLLPLNKTPRRRRDVLPYQAQSQTTHPSGAETARMRPAVRLPRLGSLSARRAALKGFEDPDSDASVVYVMR